MLVKADANGLGIDFHQFRQRILQPTADGNCPADCKVKLREFLPRDVACRVHRRPVFVHHRVEDFQAVFSNHRGHDFLYFTASGSVPHCDKLYIEFFNPFKNELFCFLRPVVLYDNAAKILPRVVQKSAFGSGAYAGIYAHYPGSPDGLLHKQVFQVLAEYGNAVIVRGVALVSPEFPDHRGGEKPF